MQTYRFVWWYCDWYLATKTFTCNSQLDARMRTIKKCNKNVYGEVNTDFSNPFDPVRQSLRKSFHFFSFRNVKLWNRFSNKLQRIILIKMLFMFELNRWSNEWEWVWEVWDKIIKKEKSKTYINSNKVYNKYKFRTSYSLYPIKFDLI